MSSDADRSALLLAIVVSLALHGAAALLLQPGLAEYTGKHAEAIPLRARLMPVVAPPALPPTPDAVPVRILPPPSADLMPAPPIDPSPTATMPSTVSAPQGALLTYYPPDELTRQPEILNALDIDKVLDGQPLATGAVVATLFINVAGRVDRVILAPEIPESPARGRLIQYLLDQDILPGEIDRQRVPSVLQVEIAGKPASPPPVLLLPSDQKPAPQ